MGRFWIAAGVILMGFAASGAGELNISNSTQVGPLVAELGSADFAVREAAQKRLAGVPREKIGELRQLAAGATDPEAKSRLAARVEELQELILTDPPTVALSVKDADVKALAAALSKATGRAFEETLINGHGGGGRYTIETDGMPFWKIYEQLSVKDPFSFVLGQRAAGIYRERAQWDRVQMQRGFAVFLKNPEPIGMANYKINMKLGWDPRIEVAGVNGMRLDKLMDENARQWTNKGPSVSGMMGRVIMIGQTLMVDATQSTGEKLTIAGRVEPERQEPQLAAQAARKKLTIAGAWPVRIVEEWKTVEIKEVGKVLEPLVFGNNEFVVKDGDVKEADGTQTVRLILERKLIDGAPMVPDPRAMIRSSIVYTQPFMEMTVVDSEGKAGETQMMRGDETLGATATVTGKAAKVMLRYPVKVRKYEVPFEFKEVGVGG